jgi:hypothetical protein
MVRHHVSDGGAGAGSALAQNPDTGSNTVYKVGGELSIPLALHSAEREYPEAARADTSWCRHCVSPFHRTERKKGYYRFVGDL